MMHQQGLQFVRRLSEWGSTYRILFECSNGILTRIWELIQLPNGSVEEVETSLKPHWEWFFCLRPIYQGKKQSLLMIQTKDISPLMFRNPCSVFRSLKRIGLS